MLKIIRDLIQPELCYIELDGLKVGTIYAFEGWHDRIREALEGPEATPEEGYLLEEQGREIATLVKRLANAELLIEKLKEEVKELNFSVALHDRNAALRTAEDSSVVGLIDSTPAKQFPNAENADGYDDILFDIEASRRAKTEVMKRLLESQTLSPELASLGRELVRLAELAEKSLGEVTE